ncbi:MAG: cytochrome c [Leptospirales bacterium]
MIYKKLVLCLFLFPFFVIACGDERPVIFLESIDIENFSGYGVNFSEGDDRKIEKIALKYHYNCSTCHKSSIAIGPDLKDDKWTHGKTPLQIFRVIYQGVNENVTRERPPKGPMPAFGGRMSSHHIWDIAVWLSGEYKTTEE